MEFDRLLQSVSVKTMNLGHFQDLILEFTPDLSFSTTGNDGLWPVHVVFDGISGLPPLWQTKDQARFDAERPCCTRSRRVPVRLRCCSTSPALTLISCRSRGI